MTQATLSQIPVAAKEAKAAKKRLDALLLKARREGHTLRELAPLVGVTAQTIYNRTKQ